VSEPSSYSPDVIVERSKKYNINVQSSDSLGLAIKEISNLSINEESTIVITGSLFLVSDFYKLL